MQKILTETKFHFLIFNLILIFSIGLFFGRIYITKSTIGGDAVHYYITLRSIAIDRDLDFEPEYSYFYNQVSAFTGNRKIPEIPEKIDQTDKIPLKYPLGTAIFLLPTFFITHLIILSDGYNLLYQTTTGLGSLIYAYFGLLLIYSLGKKVFDSKIAFLATLIIWLSTPLIYYMTMEPLNSQTLSFFCVSLFIFLWYQNREKQTFKSWILLGIVGGLMSMVRFQDGLFILIPVFDSFFIKTKLRSITVFILTILLTITPQLWANQYIFGSIFKTGYSGIGFPNLFSPKIIYSLFSIERGLFVWSPILIFSFWGLYKYIKIKKLVGYMLLFSFLIQLYIVSSWADPSQGDSFGNRILINSNIIYSIGLMQFIKDVKHQNLFLISSAGLILLNLVLIVLFVLRIIGQPY